MMRFLPFWFRAGLGCALVICAGAGVAFPLDSDTSLSLYRWDRWSGDDLPARSVRAVVYGNDGYIWSPSYGGLIRFDGQRFEAFNPPEGFGSITNGFTAASPGTDAGLWLGGTGGGVYRFVDGLFSCVLKPGDSRINNVVSILDDGRGGIWVGGTKGLVRLGRDGSGWTGTWVEDLIDLDIAGLAVGAGEVVWAATDRGLWRLAEDGPPQRHRGLGDVSISAVTADADGGLWVWVDDRGLAAVPALDSSSVEIVPLEALTEISVLYFDRDGALWLGNSYSLHRFAGGRLERWPDPVDGGALSITEDREGNLWFSSYYQGLVRLAEGKFTVFATDEGLNHDVIHTLVEDRDGAIWVGSDQGLNRIRDSHVVSIPPELGGLEDQVVLSLAMDPEGGLWIGTLDDGLHHWDGRRLSHVGPEQGLNEPGLRRLLSDGETLWIGSFKGLFAYSELGIRHWSRDDGFLNDFILAIERGHDGTLWIGTDGGGLYAMKDGRIRAITTEDGLPSMFVTDIYEDPGGALWLATAAGVCRIKDQKYATATADHGLIGRAFFQILEDDQGYVWMTSDQGISRVGRADLDSLMDGGPGPLAAVQFDRADGLQAVKMTGIAKAMKASDGRLWFSTMSGAAVVDPADLVFNSVPPPVYVEAVMGDGRPLPIVDDHIEVPAGIKNLEIRYSGLSFVSPDKVRFRYRIGGYSNDWQETETRRIAYFTSLKPRDYRFEVTACNNDGLWNDRPAVVTFTVEPHFYQTWVFYIACAFGLFFLGLSVAMIRVRALKGRQRLLAGLVEERTQELAIANKELARLARLDGLTGIANHRRFREFLDQEWRRCLRAGQPLSVIMIDIDHFKQYNDRYGHQQGDEALCNVAEVLQRATRRPGDLAARYGGEEFILVLTNTDQKGAVKLAESVRNDLFEAEIPHDGCAIGRITLSAGVATVAPERGADPDGLVSRADDALYRAKDGGRNRVEVDA
jgi:diguanylate cyclase (GGDEF)-like protein